MGRRGGVYVFVSVVRLWVLVFCCVFVCVCRRIRFVCLFVVVCVVVLLLRKWEEEVSLQVVVIKCFVVIFT